MSHIDVYQLYHDCDVGPYHYAKFVSILMAKKSNPGGTNWWRFEPFADLQVPPTCCSGPLKVPKMTQNGEKCLPLVFCLWAQEEFNLKHLFETGQYPDICWGKYGLLPKNFGDQCGLGRARNDPKRVKNIYQSKKMKKNENFSSVIYQNDWVGSIKHSRSWISLIQLIWEPSRAQK